eukprot:206658_1
MSIVNKMMSSFKLMSARSSLNLNRPFLYQNTFRFATDVGKTNGNVKITFITADGEVEVSAPIGSSLLDVCLDNELDVEGACGGECCCSTCHVYLQQDLFDSIEEPDEDELDMLDLAISVKDTSRLGCQLTVDEKFNGQVIQLPLEVVNRKD